MHSTVAITVDDEKMVFAMRLCFRLADIHVSKRVDNNSTADQSTRLAVKALTIDAICGRFHSVSVNRI